MPYPNTNLIRCEKCWRPAFQLPVGTAILIFPRDTKGEQEKFMVNLCVAHMRIFKEWITGVKQKLPNKVENPQIKLDRF